LPTQADGTPEVPVVLSGISFGGGEAIGMTYKDTVNSDATPPLKRVSTLFLFDPVGAFGDDRFPDKQHEKIFNVGLLREGTTAEKDTGTDYQAQDPDAIVTGLSRKLKPTEYPRTKFSVPGNVDDVYDWYQPFNVEWPADKAKNPTTPANWKAYATGEVTNSPHNFTVGSYHTSQLDPNDSNAFNSYFLQQIVPTVTQKVGTTLQWGSRDNTTGAQLW
jgi:hypothetical protein